MSDYQPFGMAVPERSWAAEDYRFGFNGKENDGEQIQLTSPKLNCRWAA